MRSLVLVVFSITLGLGAGCPEDGPGVAEGEGEDGGEGEGGNQSVDVGCDADDACDDGLVCDVGSGDCVAGLDCSVNPGLCAFCGEGATDCGFGAAESFCDVDHGSVCRRIKTACAPCSADAECGEGPTGLPSVCADGFCAPGCGACAKRFACLEGGCVPHPQAGTCDGAVLCDASGGGSVCPDGQTCSALGVCLKLCAADVECPAGELCVDEGGPLDGTCVQGCPLGQRVTTNGVEQVCHGDGRFGVPCPTPGSADGCPNGTECRADGACERAGCQSDAECPLARTYCDNPDAAEGGVCLDGCNDAADCGAFELCEDNQCQAQGCRSKETSCELGQFCCGAELFDDATTCPGAVDGACFAAPDPFCRTCVEDADCADVNAFGQASYCYELKRENAAGEQESLGKFCSTGCRDNNDCPRGITCQPDLPVPGGAEGEVISGCLDARCAALGN